ncbi:14-3-3-like protein C [Phragmites australis]|uniref:14-3-3-like protein C n=1 Tax=Phragmites australis TaxID=29695 RepID=UPI002D7A1F80|nr:14-3-3-like protein C [Phragmites australis]
MRTAAAAASPSREELVYTAQLSEKTHRYAVIHLQISFPFLASSSLLCSDGALQIREARIGLPACLHIISQPFVSIVYTDMLEAMISIAKLDTELTEVERGLFCMVYHSVIDEKFLEWHALSSFQLKQGKKGNWKAEKAATEFRLKVEAEVDASCYHVINIIDKHLLPSSSTAAQSFGLLPQNGICYGTLRGERKEASDLSLKAYKIASDIAEANLCPTNPFRLALSLDISEFYYEVTRSTERACRVAADALNEAECVLDSPGRE